MTTQIDVQDAETRLSELLERAEQGEEIVIARGGVPVARLTPVVTPRDRLLGFVPGGSIPASFSDPLPEDELGRSEGR